MVGRFENPILNAIAWIAFSPIMLAVFVLGSLYLWSTGQRWLQGEHG